jgi:mitochondrial fission protein ELM1
MNVLWVKDNNIGHEKQVRVLLEELSKQKNLNIDERSIKGIFPFFTYLNDIQENYYDLIIGAGHKTYGLLLDTKKYQKNNSKALAILSPSFKKDQFDIICAPEHDHNKLKNLNNVIYYEGSLSKVSLEKSDENIVMIAIGGKNKHYQFDEESIVNQINYFIALNSNKYCYIFNSRRTSISFNKKINNLVKDNSNIKFIDFNKNNVISFESILHKSSMKLITRDSVNMIYESLSCEGNTFLMDMEPKNNNNKVVKIIDKLINNKQIGFIDCGDIVKGISKMKLNTQNTYNEVFAEVEKLAFKLNKVL